MTTNLINTIITNARALHSNTFAIDPTNTCPVCGEEHDLCLDEAPHGAYFQRCPKTGGYGLFDGIVEVVILTEEDAS